MIYALNAYLFLAVYESYDIDDAVLVSFCTVSPTVTRQADTDFVLYVVLIVVHFRLACDIAWFRIARLNRIHAWIGRSLEQDKMEFQN